MRTASTETKVERLVSRALIDPVRLRHPARRSGQRVPLLAFLSLALGISPLVAALPSGAAPPLPLARDLAHSEQQRRGAGLKWDYTTGLFAYSLLQLGAKTQDDALTAYAADIVESRVGPDGAIAGYRREDYNLDFITPGRALILRYERTKDERLKRAIERLRAQLVHQPRTREGGFWHKQRYPSQMWLDGLYMASPFLAQYGRAFHEPSAFDEVTRQLILADKHLYDPRTGLFYHAWDEARAQKWADPATGRSPNFWGRAEGWYVMALVDCLDELPASHPDVGTINEILRRAAEGIARWQDPASGVWWQVLDQGKRPGNYLEASASCMFVYALAKGVNHGYLDREKFLPIAQRGYAGVVRNFLRHGPDGQSTLDGICEVAGLGYTSSSGRPRDGSFDYYVSEPVVANDLKGVAPFILASLEMQQLLDAPAAPPVVRGWADADRLLARIHAPQFPSRDFVITNFGAKPESDATSAIAQAIAACHAAGGGRVVVPAGEWITGAVRLLGGVNLCVEQGAILKFTTDPRAYPLVFTRWEGVECYSYSALIYAFEAENVAVTGHGTLDGQADETNWWGWNRKEGGAVRQRPARDRLLDLGERGAPVEERRFGEGSFLRPNFIQFYRCRNVLVEDVTMIRSPMWEIHPALSENVTVRGVQIHSHGPNNDGCDPESSRDVLIERCVFDTGDDCIAIKSGRNNDGRRVNVPSENIFVRNCRMQDGHGGVVLGSEISGGVRNVFIEDCEMDSPNLDRALRFKSNAQRGGVLENVFMRRVRVGRVREAILTVDFRYEEGANGAHPPTVRNVQLDGIQSAASPRVLYVRGFDGAKIEDLRLAHCTFRGLTAPDVVEYCGSISETRVTREPAKFPEMLHTRER